MESLEQKHPEASDPLKDNWRTTPILMHWINAVGQGLFGDEYTALTPRSDYPTSIAPLDVLHIHEKGRSNVAPYHMAAHLKALLQSGEKIYDRHVRRPRRIRGSDVAVLCPKNDLLAKYAEALRELGLRVRLDQDGWFHSPIIELAFHALSYVADPGDRHAALFLAVTEKGGHDLDTALGPLIDGELPDDPIYSIMDEVRKSATSRAVDQVVDSVIEALQLHESVAGWPDGAQARANLMRLQAEARAFVESSHEALASGGYYGGGVKTFLAWLRSRAERDDSQPPAVVLFVV
jgi:ATP-dependent exoDNAse (exonuclease V) beta subunit